MASNAQSQNTEHHKLPKLPQNAKISKRRLTREPIASKSSIHKEQIIYVSSRTPFMSAISRIRKHVTQLQKRRSQSVAAVSSKRGSVPLHKARGDRILAAAIESLDRQDAAAASVGTRNGKEEVLVKGTGKAIEKVLSVAAWLQDRAAEEGVEVRLETGSWWAVDDVEADEEGTLDVMDVDTQEEDDVHEIPDSRTRRVSVLTLRVIVI